MTKKRLALLLTITAIVAAAIAVGITALLVNIFTRKTEAREPFYRVVELNENITDPAVWGKNFPLQYDDYLRTVDQVRTRYGGSEAVPHVPSQADPRSVVAQSRLEEDPRLKTMWAGYAFATDFREERGHAHMLKDQAFTERQHVAKQPGTCLNCHASMPVAYRTAGGGDMWKGFDAINRMPYFEAAKLVQHPVACIDCHDPKTMALRVTRPAFIEGMRNLKKDPSYDPNVHATRQEMRTYVCGQCHVEYYFKGKEKRLTYPWHLGLKGDQILEYYDTQTDHADWTHAESGAKALKAQHPEFEMYNQGIHARSGVACADCHMPYKREGSLKISDHHVRSPLLNINRACQSCHRWEEAELRARVETIQQRTYEMRNVAMDALMSLIADIKTAGAGGASQVQLDEARKYQRKAQFLLDFVEAENSTGFHADQEAARLMVLSVDYSRRGELALRGVNPGAAALPQPQIPQLPPVRAQVSSPGAER
ncbi:MAG TPA: ammonia-forming cytochrome c nitrite reductase subunit c552 [Thermoanaerobaculia bacterium]|nr:ammonia-forming cytochrome c nitrite reductase subunit c552 [Thermoanaerobaculia bacterium]